MKKLYSARTIIFIFASSLLLQLGTLCFQSRGAVGDVDLSFDPGSGVNGTINAIALQPDGKVIIGGEFTTVKGLVRTNLARLNPDGSGDSSFTFDPLNSPVHSVTMQPDGKVLVGGENNNGFGLTRLNSDGSPDTNFNANAYAAIVSTEPYNPVAVSTIVVQPDGKVLFAGESLLRLNGNGTLDNSFTSGAPAYVYSMALQSDGKVIIGGYFFSGSSYGLARLQANGSLDNSFDAAARNDGLSYSIVLQPDGKVLIGGRFIRVNGTNVTSIARLYADGSVDSTFGVTATGSGTLPASVYAMALQPDGKVLIGGQFTSINGYSRTNLARLNADGGLDLSYPSGGGGVGGQPAYGTFVKAIAVQTDGKVVIGGAFTTVNGTNRNRAALLNADGSLDGSFHPGGGMDGPVSSLVAQPDGKLLVGGGQRVVTGGGTSVVIDRLNPNASPDSGFNPGTGANDDVVCVARQADGKVLIGGSFTTVNGTDRFNIARLNTDGTLDNGFNPHLEALPSAATTAILVQPDGKILVAGYFLNWFYVEFESGWAEWYEVSYYWARFHPDGSRDLTISAASDSVSWAPYYYGWYAYPPTALALQADGKILIGGCFININGASRAGMARFNTDGTLDSSFVPAIGGSVGAIAVQLDGKILAGGYLGLVNGFYTYGIKRLNANGSPDATFNAGTGTDTSTQVNAIALQSDGKVLIGGTFTTISSTNRNGIARLNADGTLDSSFNPGAGVNGSVRSIALQPDGNVVIGGEFLTINGVLRPHVARLYGDSVAPSLNVTRSSASVIVSWPATGSNFQLQETTNLALPSSWSPVAQPTVTNAGQISVTVPTSIGSKFFRLKSP